MESRIFSSFLILLCVTNIQCPMLCYGTSEVTFLFQYLSEKKVKNKTNKKKKKKKKNTEKKSKEYVSCLNDL